MKRNLDLMRDILLFVENSDKPLLLVSNLASLCSDSGELAYNVYLLIDAGFLNAEKARNPFLVVEPFPEYRIYGLTMAGCDYLNSIRNQSVWEQTKSKVREIGGNVSLKLVSEIASKIILSLVESHLPL